MKYYIDFDNTLYFAEDKKKTEKNIFELFESEFGRTLSPMEYEIINGWKENDVTEEIIVLALKEAIYNGVSNFRYIDKIIYEWNKKGIKKKVVEEEATSNIFEFDWLNDEE